jgi:anti-sigma factor RsiW
VRCAESLRVQAYFDAELDAVSATEVERHLEHCADCRALLADLEQVRGALRRDTPYARMPAALRAQVLRTLDREQAPRAVRWMPRRGRAQGPWWGALYGAGGTAVAATLAFMLIVPRFANPVLDELLSAHVRSLMPAHLIDVVSTDKHTVKPWFAGHTDVSPAVADFEPQGYKLLGGRADYLEHQRSAVVVYQHGAHIINVFTWGADGHALPNDVTRSGYHLAFWSKGDLRYCAVSDTGWDELLGLVRLLKELPA